jgi:hypothetical protein
VRIKNGQVIRTSAVAAAALSLLTSCSGAGDGRAQSSPPAASTRSTVDDDAREAISPNPAFDQGHTVHLTAAGVLPQSLVLFCCDRPVTFKNETSGTVSIVLDISKVSSGPIAPGATWQWTPPNPESITFHYGEAPTTRGHIQIESPSW